MAFDCDILISGGGIAGLTAAAAFGTAGFDVICVDPAPPVVEKDAQGADMRTTAFLQPARRVLEAAEIWPALAPHAAPLQIMRIVDAGGEVAEPRVTREFDASDISDQPFGWNFPNWLLRRELVARLDDLPNVDFRPGTGTTSLFTRTAEARVGLTDGSRIRCKLVVAADGRASPMREAAGISVSTRRYGQKALAFAVTHPIPHENVSTEVHRTGGPFTLVPLTDLDGMPSSAVVWMDDGPLTVARAASDTTAFEAEMSERSCHLFGPLSLASPRNVWPIINQHADRLSGERLALIAEAAHVVPPIGAQGLNMSLNDLACLLDLAVAHPEVLGDGAMLEKYHKARYADIQLRVRGIDLLNRASQASSPLARDARAAGLNALYAMPQVRKMLMQMGLGVR
ncbi:UbiH/UbiF family hydroxylase [Sulfitobacter mediterraneus]|uniref:UbiH/UbiF family hydroxylase n=1 Tax=Sulfitobacter mediterraneus TaxID=83219 RepID=UPI001931B464|nr:UbiH/UbiF family hydroxylase [Sulfitobacter mediterraneus]MBM1309405.1 UbiH/UbiF family hydroxylase [Sulfitobacter mediterraneus]MBM1313290.1 UbiH/UbiF family hydroxylase [Sulfitobacter mediterraneus]MBM1321674.1 UbiH/UbiF family hydroxylase [Sulfitobacter mediterraneus]MBM1325561.1 UbiH/UbiF family hydroxylase [Sulfitobacter mediterraneus]MBM1396907.1 UbiH/UbiF family hydroxylase [Sulfitobacter mediterraneus]